MDLEVYWELLVSTKTRGVLVSFDFCLLTIGLTFCLCRSNTGPTRLRTDSKLPATGIMQFDSDDISDSITDIIVSSVHCDIGTTDSSYVTICI